MMLQRSFRNFREYHASNVDPEARIFRIAFRTALGCLASIAVFQFLGQDKLVGWAIFAALGFSQIDTLDRLSNRIPYLIANIFIFTLFAGVGNLLGLHPIWFLISVPIVIGICGYVAVHGTHYFNSGGWVAFIYIACGSNVGDSFNALHISLTFLSVGVICLMISLLIFPERPRRKISASFIRVLHRLHWMTQPDLADAMKVNYQLEKLLDIHDTTLLTYLGMSNYSEVELEACQTMGKIVHQIFLTLKNIEVMTPSLVLHATFPQTTLDQCYVDTAQLLQNVINAMSKNGATTKIDISERISSYREKIKSVQIAQLHEDNPDHMAMLDYSSYLFNFIQVWTLLDQMQSCVQRFDWK